MVAPVCAQPSGVAAAFPIPVSYVLSPPSCDRQPGRGQGAAGVAVVGRHPASVLVAVRNVHVGGGRPVENVKNGVLVGPTLQDDGGGVRRGHPNGGVLERVRPGHRVADHVVDPGVDHPGAEQALVRDAVDEHVVLPARADHVTAPARVGIGRSDLSMPYPCGKETGSSCIEEHPGPAHPGSQAQDPPRHSPNSEQFRSEVQLPPAAALGAAVFPD